MVYWSGVTRSSLSRALTHLRTKLVGVEFDAINGLLVDPRPQFLELLLLEILVQGIGLWLALVINLRQLRIAEHAIDQSENLSAWA